MTYDEICEKLGHIIPCYSSKMMGCHYEPEDENDSCGERGYCLMYDIYLAGLEAGRKEHK